MITSAVLMLAGVTEAREWRVDKNGGGDFTDIQPAVEAAAAGDTIRIGPGRFDTLHPSCVASAWTEDAIVTVVQDNLTFIGSGTDVTILGMREFYWSDSENPKGICSIDGYSATIKDLNIENIEQGIYWWRGRLNLENCIIKGSHPSFGGIFFAADGGSIRGCRIEMGGGGAGLSCAYMDSLEVENCVFEGYGYGFSAGEGAGQISFSDCIFDGNRIAIAYSFGAYGWMENVTISNTVSKALIILYNAMPVTLNGVHIDGAAFGLMVDGGVSGLVSGANVIIENTTTEAVSLAGDAIVTLNHSHILPVSGLGVRCAGYWGDFQTLDFTGNYWGTTDPDSIAAMITDQNDDPALQCIVQFEPFADGPVPNEKRSMGSIKAMFR